LKYSGLGILVNVILMVWYFPVFLFFRTGGLERGGVINLRRLRHGQVESVSKSKANQARSKGKSTAGGVFSLSMHHIIDH
jgi:hypothetical protein